MKKHDTISSLLPLLPLEWVQAFSLRKIKFDKHEETLFFLTEGPRVINGINFLVTKSIFGISKQTVSARNSEFPTEDLVSVVPE